MDMRGIQPEQSTAEPEADLIPRWPVSFCLVVIGLTFLFCSLPSLFYDGVKSEVGYYTVGYFIQSACFFLLPLFIVIALFRQPPAALGLKRGFTLRLAAIGISGGALLYLANLGVSYLLMQLFSNYPQDGQQVVGLLFEAQNGVEMLLLLFCLLIAAPIGEEVFFRGFVLGALRVRLKRWPALICSAAIFAAMHFNIWYFPVLFFGGLGFAYLYERFRHLGVTIVAHMMWNCIALVLLMAAQMAAS